MPTSLSLLRTIAVAVVIAIVASAIIGVGKLELNSHYSAYFDEDDPAWLAHREIASLYARTDSALVLLKSARSFLGADNYRLLEDLTARLAAQPFTSRALSISELGILGDLPAGDGTFIPSAEQLEAQGRALGLLLAEDGRLAAILVQTELQDKDAKTAQEAVASIRTIVASAIDGLPVSAHFTGTLVLNAAYIEVVQRDLGRILPMLLLAMIMVLGLFMRSWRAIGAMLPVGILSVIAAFGLVGLTGAELAAINSFTPVIIFCISIAGCVHMALSYDHYRDGGENASDAALAAARYNLLPMLLANGTTAVGFLGLVFSPSPPVRIMGYLVATGVMVSFVLCLSLLPVLQARLDPWKPVGQDRSAPIENLATLVTRRRMPLVVVFVALAIPATWLASRNVVSDNVFGYFAPGHAFSRDTRLVEQELSGINEIIYSLESGRRYGFFDAQAVDAMRRLSKWLDGQPEVNRVVSIADTAVLGEAVAEGRLQQRLDFYRNRIDSSADINPLLSLEVSEDYASSAVTAYLRPLDSRRLIDFDERVLAWADENLGGFSVRSGGASLMFASLGERNIRGMLAALTIGLIAAAVLLGLTFRSLGIAWISLACNALPILLVYSVWAILDGQISIGAAVVMGMILGIVLDDTIYLLVTYRYALRRRITDPVRYALRRVGPALIVTTTSLICGLSLGILSDFGPIRSMSALAVAIIGTALVVDLLLLPALLLFRETRRGSA